MHQFASPRSEHDLVDPPSEPREVFAKRFRFASTILVSVVIALAAAALAGWILAIPALTSARIGLDSLKTTTAVALIALGVAVLAGRTPEPERPAWQQWLLWAGLGIATLVAFVTVVEHLTGFDLWIDQLIASDPAAGAPGRTAFTAAVAVLLLVAAAWWTDRSGGYDIAQGCIAGAALLATFDGVGFVFGLRSTIVPGAFGIMAVPTAGALLLLCLAFLFARPTQGVMAAGIDAGPAGLLIRQLLPALVLMPLVIAWLSWYGVRGMTYSPEFAIALVVTLSIGALVLAMLVGSTILRTFEDKRLAAEASRMKTEARLQRAVFESPVPIVIHDRDTILNMSRAWSDISGYTLDDTPTLTAWIAKAHVDQPTAATKYFREIGEATDTVSGGEFNVQTSAGEIRVWEFSSTPLEPPQSEGRLFVTTAVDVTLREHAERELRKTNEALERRIVDRTAELTKANDSHRKQSDQLREQSLLLDLVKDGILVRDLYGTIVYWSAGAAEMYGFTKDEALGRLSHQLLNTQYPVPVKDIEAQVQKTGVWEGDTTQVTKSGKRLKVESRWTLTRTERGSPEGFLEVNRDITARKQAEDSLRDSELRFRAVSESAIEGILSLESSGAIRYWNPGAERLFGLSAAEAVGLPVARVIPDEAIAKYMAPDADRGIGTRFETQGTRKDGSAVPVEVSLSSWVTTQGVRSFTVIVRDITERKRAERALEAKNEELARSNQELEQFAYVASHDLQEPLRMVSNYTQLLGRRYRDKLDGDANEFIDFAVDGAKRMQELIHDLLQYARVGTRGKEFKPMPVARIVADALANLTSAIEEAGAELVVDPLPTVSCDASQIAQVFQNLLGNAVKFRRPGQRPIVRISATRADRAWAFSVQDNGIGIDRKYFDRIFQMFQRLHTRGEYSGTGIGLSLCKKIIERHGGRIRVESEPGRGTTFAFTIPDPV
jgi:PAS domain S-box-containing protein